MQRIPAGAGPNAIHTRGVVADCSDPAATYHQPPVSGRVAQWESARFTRERSLVRNQPRPSRSPSRQISSYRGRTALERGLGPGRVPRVTSPAWAQAARGVLGTL